MSCLEFIKRCFGGEVQEEGIEDHRDETQGEMQRTLGNFNLPPKKFTKNSKMPRYRADLDKDCIEEMRRILKMNYFSDEMKRGYKHFAEYGLSEESVQKYFKKVEDTRNDTDKKKDRILLIGYLLSLEVEGESDPNLLQVINFIYSLELSDADKASAAMEFNQYCGNAHQIPLLFDLSNDEEVKGRAFTKFQACFPQGKLKAHFKTVFLNALRAKKNKDHEDWEKRNLDELAEQFRGEPEQSVGRNSVRSTGKVRPETSQLKDLQKQPRVTVRDIKYQ